MMEQGASASEALAALEQDRRERVRAGALIASVGNAFVFVLNTALSITSLGVARALMRKMTTPQGAVMNLQPKFLIVPAALEDRKSVV